MKLQNYFYVGLGNAMALRRASARTEAGAVDERPPGRRAPATPPTARKRVVRKRPPTEEEIDRARGYVSKLGGQAR